MRCFVTLRSQIGTRLDPTYIIQDRAYSNHIATYSMLPLSDMLVSPPQYGANESAKDGDPEVDFRYIRITDIDEFGNLRADSWKTAEKTDQKYLLKDGDLLFARSGATAGKSYIYHSKDGKAIFAGYMIRFRFDLKKINPQYVFYYTQLDRYAKWVSLIQRAAGQPNINSEEFKSLEIPVPERGIQDQIVTLMDNAYAEKKVLESEADKLHASIDGYMLDQLKVGLKSREIQKTYSVSCEDIKNKRFDPHHHQPYFMQVVKQLSENFSIKNLGEVSLKITSGATPLSGGDSYTNADLGIPFIRSGDISEQDSIDFKQVLFVKKEIHEKKLKSSKLKKGDLLIAIVGATIGRVSVYDYDREANINQAIAIVRLGKDYDPQFVKYFMMTKIGQIQLEWLKRPVARANLNLDEIASILVPEIDIAIQKRISDEISSRMKKALSLRDDASRKLNEAKSEVEKILFGGAA